jgi:hypothetical protein
MLTIFSKCLRGINPDQALREKLTEKLAGLRSEKSSLAETQ